MVVKSHDLSHFDFCILTFAMNIDFKLYLITDRKVAKVPLVDAVRLALEGGVKAVQLREKDLPVRELLAVAKDLRKLTREHHAKLFINDRVDVAIGVEADGVHLGVESIPCSAARKLVGKKMLIGVSTHSLEEAKRAKSEGADFITFGPVFDTPSKRGFGAPLGTQKLGEVVREVSLPVFGLGGVNGRNLGDVLYTGARGVAMISAILASKNIRKTAKDMMEVVRLMDRMVCISCKPRE